LKKHILVAFLLCSCFAYSQARDIAGVEYSGFLAKKGDPDFSRFKVWLNVPIFFKNKNHILISGLKYSNINLNMDGGYGFNTAPLDRIHVIEYSLGYLYTINEKWKLIAQITPSIASNLETSITSEDLIWSGGVLFINTLNKEKERKLTLGLVYNQTMGIPAPIPFVVYSNRPTEKISYTLGVPITKLKYHFNEETSFESFITLDGYYANLSNNIAINEQIAEKISMTAVVLGVGYERYFGKHLNLYIKGGYTIHSSLRLFENIKDEVFNFNIDKSFIFRTGLKFNF
tara:strand:- start:755164 stop:756024 length:861 start_codon:yes stop_codon:yes gene_type:complete